MQRKLIISVSAIVIAMGMTFHAYGYSKLSLYTKLSSDWVYHGVSETGQNPSLGFNLEYQISSLWVAGAELRDAEPDGLRQRHRNATGYIGVESPLNDDWFVGGYFIHRSFPGAFREWDYNEVSLRFSHHTGFQFKADFSDDYYATNQSSRAFEVSYGDIIQERIFWHLTAGYFDLHNQLDYRYANAKVGYQYKRWVAQAGYHWVNERVVPSPVGAVKSPGWVLEITCHCF